MYPVKDPGQLSPRVPGQLIDGRHSLSLFQINGKRAGRRPAIFAAEGDSLQGKWLHDRFHIITALCFLGVQPLPFLIKCSRLRLGQVYDFFPGKAVKGGQHIRIHGRSGQSLHGLFANRQRLLLHPGISFSGILVNLPDGGTGNDIVELVQQRRLPAVG